MRSLRAFAAVAALIALAMPAYASTGVIVRGSSGGLVFRRACDDSSGNIVSTGTTTLKIAELEDDGSLKTYDFSNNTFTTATVTTETVNMTNQAMNNGADTTGVWTYSLGTLTGFTKGKVYIAITYNSGASPARDRTEFEFGGSDGDLQTDSSGNVDISLTQTIHPTTYTANTVEAGMVGGAFNLGRGPYTAQGGTASTITLDAGASSVDGTYVGHFIKLMGGTGSGQFATITAYTGSTKVATITRPGVGTWTTSPDNTTIYQIEALAEAVTFSNLDKANYGLATSQPGVTIPTVTTIINPVVASSVTGNVGGISGITFPSNFGTFSIDGSGRVTLTPAEHTAISGTDVPAALNTAQPGSPTANSPFAHLANADTQATNAAATSASNATSLSTLTGRIPQSILFDGSGYVKSNAQTGNVATINGMSPPTNWNLLNIDSSGRGLLQPTQTFSTTGAVGSVTGNVATVGGLTPPTNWHALSIDSSGRLTLTPAEHSLISGTDIPAAPIFSGLGTPGNATGLARKQDVITYITH